MVAREPSEKDCMTNTHTSVEDLLTEHEVAKLLKVSVATIRRRRLFREPPNFLKIGASVRYKREAIERLIAPPPGLVHHSDRGVRHQGPRAVLRSFGCCEGLAHRMA
jgi:hypothetical protein